MGFSWNRKYFLGGFCFEESVADVRVGLTFIQVDLQIVVESNSIEEFADPWSCWGSIWLLFFSWSSEDGIKEKRRGLLQYFVDDVWVLQSHGVLDSCVIWQSEMGLGKARCLYIGSHEDSWLNWKETRRGFDQVKLVSSRACKPMGMETET